MQLCPMVVLFGPDWVQGNEKIRDGANFADSRKGVTTKPKVLKAVIDTFNDYYGKEPDGMAFPIQNWVPIPGMEEVLKKADSHWHGRIDLTNTQDLRNFKIYVGKKN